MWAYCVLNIVEPGTCPWPAILGVYVDGHGLSMENERRALSVPLAPSPVESEEPPAQCGRTGRGFYPYAFGRDLVVGVLVSVRDRLPQTPSSGQSAARRGEAGRAWCLTGPLSRVPPQEMLKYSKHCEGAEDLQEALSSILGILKAVNDSMHLIAITGYDVRPHSDMWC